MDENQKEVNLDKELIFLNTFWLKADNEYESEDVLLINWRELFKGKSNSEIAMKMVILLVFLSAPYLKSSDIHFLIKWDKYSIKYRKDKKLKQMVGKDLVWVYSHFDLDKYWFKKEYLKQFFELFWNQKLEFDYKNDRFARIFFDKIFIDTWEMTRNAFLPVQKYNSLSTGTNISIWKEDYDYRIELVPTKYWWKVVWNLVYRLLANNIYKSNYEYYQDLIDAYLYWKWILIVWWQVNSWKTTSIYGFFNDLHEKYPEVEFFEVGEPIEKRLPYVGQFEVQFADNKENTMKSSDFTSSFLRMDWDIINWWEARDYVTLSNTIQLALTWHNTFATMHIWTIFQVFDRVKEYKWEPYALLNTTRAIIVQQLVPQYTKVPGENWILIKDLRQKVNLTFVDNLIKFNNSETNERDLVLRWFYKTIGRYINLLERNIVIPEEKKNPFIEAYRWWEISFFNYIASNYYYYDTLKNDTQWLKLLFEVVFITSENKNLMLKEDKSDFFDKAEDKFIPMFLNSFFLQQTFNLDELYNLSMLIYS